MKFNFDSIYEHRVMHAFADQDATPALAADADSIDLSLYDEIVILALTGDVTAGGTINIYESDADDGTFAALGTALNFTIAISDDDVQAFVIDVPNLTTTSERWLKTRLTGGAGTEEIGVIALLRRKSYDKVNAVPAADDAAPGAASFS